MSPTSVDANSGLNETAGKSTFKKRVLLKLMLLHQV